MTSVDKLVRRVRRHTKHSRLRLRPASPATHPLLLVVGCQRSGTTMLTELLDRDGRVRVFGELEHLFDDRERHHRLRDDTMVRRQLDRSGAMLNVIKPLVESHRIEDLLGLQHGGRVIWMFRHYRDVASSNLKRFGADNGHRNLAPIIADDPDDWRNAGLSSETRAVVRSLVADGLSGLDAAALFWYCRNTLWFEQRLSTDDRVRMCRYESLVADPDAAIASIYEFVGAGAPPAPVDGDAVYRTSVGKGRAEIGDGVGALCEQMLAQLEQVDAARSVLAAG